MGRNGEYDKPVEPKIPDDVINHPQHYKGKNGLETIDVIEGFTDAKAWSNGNTIKYICRWQKKNGLEDLYKARFYLNRLIKIVEKENKEGTK